MKICYNKSIISMLNLMIPLANTWILWEFSTVQNELKTVHRQIDFVLIFIVSFCKPESALKEPLMILL